MTGLLEFEWERPIYGYRLERLDADLLTFVHDSDNDYWIIVNIDSSAPQWVRDLIRYELIGGAYIIKHYLDTSPYGDRYLVANGRETERYRPVDMYPALFMELADSEATPEGAARFINRYGPPVRPSGSILGPVDLSMVLNQMKAIKSAVRLWERYRKTGKAKALIKRVTDELKLEAHLYVGLREKPEHDRISMVLVPPSLTAAIWLQFAQAITASYGFRQCDECLTWFQVAPGKGRPEKKFCSNACSMRAYRKRKVAKSKSKKRTASQRSP